MQSVPSRPVDLVHLARYTLGSASHEREVLALFCTQSGLCLQRLRKARDDKAWQSAAHTINGSARDIGAWRLARTAREAESLKGPVRDACGQAALKALENDVAEATGFIRHLLADA